MTQLPIGTVFGTTEPAELNAAKLNRHTFWCGQSGSGKTYALGVLLEQVLLRTELPILVLDPNADFVRLGEPRAETDAATAAALRGLDVRVLHSTQRDVGEALKVRFLGLSVPSKAAVLRLDPIADAEEYNMLLRINRFAEGFDESTYMSTLRESSNPAQVQLAMRIENLQVMEWDVWSRGALAATDVIAERPRATVLDLGGFTHPSEPKAAALAVLEQLWVRREERRPILIVIDEAHNICPPNPQSPVERALTALVQLIAAEGRKFGLWLLLSTQRPTKIHPNVLSQCDNLGLMRMNSPRDLLELSEVFGYAPEAMVQASSSFVQGRALFAGGFLAEPAFVQMGPRLTIEGGADVRVPLS
jgi:DNA helicase HerA-like ATPase